MSGTNPKIKPVNRTNIRCRIALLICTLLSANFSLAGQHHQTSNQESTGISLQHLALMDPVIADSISRHEMPGAVVLVSHKGRTVWRKAYGARALQPAREEMTADTVFDLASLT